MVDKGAANRSGAGIVEAIAAGGDVVEVGLVLIERRSEEAEFLSEGGKQSRVERRYGGCASDDGGGSVDYDVVAGVGVKPKSWRAKALV